MKLNRLREVASLAGACGTYSGRWNSVRSGAALYVGSDNEMGHIAEVVPWAAELAEHIATFDPPMVLALLDVAEAADAALTEPDVELVEALARTDALADALDRLREVTG